MGRVIPRKSFNIFEYCFKGYPKRCAQKRCCFPANNSWRKICMLYRRAGPYENSDTRMQGGKRWKMSWGRPLFIDPHRQTFPSFSSNHFHSTSATRYTFFQLIFVWFFSFHSLFPFRHIRRFLPCPPFPFATCDWCSVAAMPCKRH